MTTLTIQAADTASAMDEIAERLEVWMCQEG